MTKITPQINFKSYLQGIKDIEKRNKAFHKLTDEEKRLEIAWDSLLLIMEGSIRPAGFGKNSCYWDKKLFKATENLSSKELQKTLIERPKSQKCTVCERGITMLSTIRLGNSIDGFDNDRENGHEDNIQGFIKQDFYNMEKEYEHSYYSHPYKNNTLEKMANICCNVLVNGNFNTEDKTDYLK